MLDRRGILRACLAAKFGLHKGLANAGGFRSPSPAGGIESGSVSPSSVAGSISLRAYLTHQAMRITDKALADFPDAAALRRSAPARRRQFMEMMGLADLPPQGQRPPLNVTVTGVVKREKYRIEKLYYESIPKLFVVGNLYVPNSLASRAPAVLYVSGHTNNQKVDYQSEPRHFAELGFVCLLIETLEGAEMHGDHHGPYRQGAFHWYSRGYTPAGVELLNGIRGLDVLVQRPEVDATRLGVTGVSGGGAYSWSIPAADERVKIASPVCGTGTLASHVADHTIDSHCDCLWWINSGQWDLADLGALIAPRPLLIASSNRDEFFTVASVQAVYGPLKQLYARLGAAENLSQVVAPGAHGYHPPSRAAIYAWFLQHLQGKRVPAESLRESTAPAASEEDPLTLQVYENGPPAGRRAPSIQESFIKLAVPPQISGVGELKEHRESVIAGLRRTSFAAFPATPPPLNFHVDHEFEAGNTRTSVFGFTPEEGWNLRGALHHPLSAARPDGVVLGLRSPREGFAREGWLGGATLEFLRPLPAPLAKAIVELRGTGDTVWGADLQWYLRRAAAWTGRTLASMWVYDALRALACVRQLPNVDSRRISLAAQGEMAVVALYAALLDGNVEALYLADPPATQDVASQPDGGGDAIEMLGCLRFTDLPQVAGMLYPAKLIFIGDRPRTYDWAKDLYTRLGGAHRFQQVSSMREINPE